MDRHCKGDKILKKLEEESKKCIQCGLCMKNCTVYDEIGQTPKEVMINMLNTKKTSNEAAFACTQCKFCISVCPKDIDQSDIYQETREYLHDTIKEYPEKKILKSAKMHQKMSFLKTFSANDIPQNDRGKTVFFPGCSFQSSKPKQVMRIYSYLKANIDDCFMMLDCCGNPTLTIGAKEKHNDHIKNLFDKLKEKNVEKIIVACPNCYKILSRELKNIEVEFIWDVVIKKGIPFITASNIKHKEQLFFVHDPCPARDVSSVQNSVREIALELGVKTEEFEYNKDITTCCGSGAMLHLTNKNRANHQVKKRANQAKSDYILTYCQECTESLISGGKKAYHLSDFIFGNDVDNTQSPTTLAKWVNRYKLTRVVKQIKK